MIFSKDWANSSSEPHQPYPNALGAIIQQSINILYRKLLPVCFKRPGKKKEILDSTIITCRRTISILKRNISNINRKSGMKIATGWRKDRT